MANDPELTEQHLRERFMAAGERFFSWNSGKNTPNILSQLSDGVAK